MITILTDPFNWPMPSRKDLMCLNTLSNQYII